ncbi:hypothetical protein AB0L59_28675 [Streptomyces sp. NPDC052109]|uniref:hypothetical protein n=1 Tax=Streptomyces sp. NPDC052109 TaxID=3155527 RepID=UPI003448DEAC
MSASPTPGRSSAPFEAVSVQEAVWWHPVHAQGAARIWLRRKAAEVGATSTGAVRGWAVA